jgi:hypothetical protein
MLRGSIDFHICISHCYRYREHPLVKTLSARHNQGHASQYYINTLRSHNLQVVSRSLHSGRRLLVTANIVSSSQIIVTLMLYKI